MTVVWQSSEYLIGNFSVDCRMLLLYFFSWIFFFFLSDGRLHITTPIDPLFLLLPYLKKAKEVLLCFDFLFWNRYKTHNIIWQTSFLSCSSVFTSKGYRLWHLLCKKIKYWIYKWQQIVNRLMNLINIYLGTFLSSFVRVCCRVFTRKGYRLWHLSCKRLNTECINDNRLRIDWKRHMVNLIHIY